MTSSNDPQLFSYKGCNFIQGLFEKEHLDTLEEFPICDSDVFAIIYPKSGTTWLQFILAQMFHSDKLGEKKLPYIVPWIEVKLPKVDFHSLPSPRTFVSNMLPSLMPRGLRERGKVIYVVRNPKDVAVSFYYFHNSMKYLTDKPDFGEFLQDFLQGSVFGGSWFDHFKEWCSQKEEFNYLFLTFEEMVQDLRGTVVKISDFLGKNLDDSTIDKIVDMSSFNAMKQNPRANYCKQFPEYFNTDKGSMLRKGKVGDWKNLFTVAQNELFDKIYKEKMLDTPVDLKWDL